MGSIEQILNAAEIPTTIQIKIHEYNRPTKIGQELKHEIESVAMSKRIINSMIKTNEENRDLVNHYNLVRESYNKSNSYSSQQHENLEDILSIILQKISNFENIYANCINCLGLGCSYDSYMFWDEVYSMIEKLMGFVENPFYFKYISKREWINYEFEEHERKFVKDVEEMNHIDLASKFRLLMHDAYEDFDLIIDSGLPNVVELKNSHFFRGFYEKILKKINNYVDGDLEDDSDDEGNMFRNPEFIAVASMMFQDMGLRPTRMYEQSND